jgi:hypothetical protein
MFTEKESCKIISQNNDTIKSESINKEKKMEIALALGAAWWAWNHFMN